MTIKTSNFNYSPEKPYRLKGSGESLIKIFFFDPKRFYELIRRERGYLRKSKYKEPREIMLFMDWLDRTGDKIKSDILCAECEEYPVEYFGVILKNGNLIVCLDELICSSCKHRKELDYTKKISYRPIKMSVRLTFPTDDINDYSVLMTKIHTELEHFDEKTEEQLFDFIKQFDEKYKYLKPKREDVFKKQKKYKCTNCGYIDPEHRSLQGIKCPQCEYVN